MKYLKFYMAMGLMIMGAATGCGAVKEEDISQTAITSSPSTEATDSSEETGETSEIPEQNTETAASNQAQQTEAATPIDEVQQETALSSYAVQYQQILMNIEATYNEYCTYALYDLNGDGIKELVTIEGTCEADDLLHVYTYHPKKNEAEEVSSQGNVGNAGLYKESGREGIIAVQGKQGCQTVTNVTMVEGVVQTEVILQNELADGEAYYQTDEPIDQYMVNDYSALGL